MFYVIDIRKKQNNDFEREFGDTFLVACLQALSSTSVGSTSMVQISRYVKCTILITLRLLLSQTCLIRPAQTYTTLPFENYICICAIKECLDERWCMQPLWQPHTTLRYIILRTNGIAANCTNTMNDENKQRRYI